MRETYNWPYFKYAIWINLYQTGKGTGLFNLFFFSADSETSLKLSFSTVWNPAALNAAYTKCSKWGSAIQTVSVSGGRFRLPSAGSAVEYLKFLLWIIFLNDCIFFHKGIISVFARETLSALKKYGRLWSVLLFMLAFLRTHGMTGAHSLKISGSLLVV